MIIFPAMDLMNGNVVKLEALHHKGQEKVYGTPGLVSDRWLSAGAQWLHVVDLNAALAKGMPNHLALLTILPKVGKYRAKLQWGGGIRDAGTLRLLLDAELGDTGANIDRVVVGTRAKDVPIAGFLYTNVAVEGRGKGVDWEPVRAVIETSPKPVTFSGGVSSLDEVGRFKELGAYGTVIGSALYTNKIDFAAAKARAES